MRTDRNTLKDLLEGYKYVPGKNKRRQVHARHGDVVQRHETFFDFMAGRRNIDCHFVNRVADFLGVSDSTGQDYYRLWKLAKKMLAAGDTVPEIAMACGVGEETILKMKARHDDERTTNP